MYIFKNCESVQWCSLEIKEKSFIDLIKGVNLFSACVVSTEAENSCACNFVRFSAVILSSQVKNHFVTQTGDLLSPENKFYKVDDDLHIFLCGVGLGIFKAN